MGAPSKPSATTAQKNPSKQEKLSTKRLRATRSGTELMAELRKAYPDAHCALVHEGPLQLLVATILSAQCTDARVNLVTPNLFKRYPDVKTLAGSDPRELESLISSTGFFRAKARNIRSCCEKILTLHSGRVPNTLSELIALPGVGRKTANVVLGVGFGLAEGVVVDTHVGRLAQRLGLSRAKEAVRIEQDLMTQFDRRDWIDLSHLLIWHGRQVCKARTPLCEKCTLLRLCPTGQERLAGA